MKTRLAIALVVLSNVLGNFALTLGVKAQPAMKTLFGPVYALLNPWMIGGILLLIIWTLARMALLSWVDLSYVLPVTSIGYVLSTLMGVYFLGESVSMTRWAGTLLIVAGTALVGPTAPNTTAPRRQ
ncbi:MAG: hypothetical protein IRZ15_14535 [Bryobacteraceae bacterium]|nr:hypothetical protein [Bryobacteraceae bacterium]